MAHHDPTAGSTPPTEKERRELWNAMAGAWFTRGPDDPKLALLRVDVDKGEYWEPDVSKVVQFFSIAKAALTRTPPKHVGEHREFQN